MPEMELPIGPQHPALKEPVNFRVIVDGERIVRLALDISYNHRGIEKAAETREFSKSLYLIERICGICSHAHATNFAKGIEALMGVEAPRRAQWIRTLVAELERIHSHLLWLGGAGPASSDKNPFLQPSRGEGGGGRPAGRPRRDEAPDPGGPAEARGARHVLHARHPRGGDPPHPDPRRRPPLDGPRGRPRRGGPRRPRQPRRPRRAAGRPPTRA